MQVERNPEKTALIADGKAWTFEELNRHANRLAHHLESIGAGPGDLVAVYLHRCAEAVAALLGILKSGGAYVPLEPSYPEARIASILSSLGVRYLITSSSELEKLATLTDLPALQHVLCVKGSSPEDAPARAGWSLWTRQHLSLGRADNPPCRARSGDLAYIIFTSGSTGTPKGVEILHRPVINLIQWVNETFQVGPGDLLLFVTSLCFDLSVYDIFGTLAAGACIRIASDLELEDPETLARILFDEPITFWDSAPAALQQLVRYFPQGGGLKGERLKRVFLSGDWIPLGLPAQIRGAFPKAKVISLGGATEATIWSNYHPVGELAPSWVSIPYGRPICNARYYILDGALDLCPIGVEGDLYIGGECLFVGYANDPELTVLKKVPDPMGEFAGSSLYRTGDRARFFADGKIEFRGRIDHQVKIRGFRIELGEVEVALLKHPAVRDAIVLAREDAGGEKRLVAYLVSPTQPPSVSELRRFLHSQIPDFMVPSAFVMLEEFPVSANGKLDRQALPAPDSSRPRVDEAFAAPRNRTEQVLMEIWREVLGLEQIGIYDNFFELGGDSILSIQIISRARQAGLRVVPRQLFEHQTIAGLAAVAHDSAAEVPLVDEPIEGELPLTPIQHWFLEQGLADPHHFNQSLLLQVERPLNPELLACGVEQLVEHHCSLRLRFRLGESGWSQTCEAQGGATPFTRLDLTALVGGARGHAIEEAAAALQASLNLDRGPL
ncbi:MAG TPA: amino acid adenylation domain-containing protein, partial [Gemmatimonadales bacterium]|nr:amino acid adenylation domain-containing protein [Gemmatimonadales bacterium]